MFGIDELKKSIEITEDTVECPVKGCNEKVDRRRQGDKKGNKFKCPVHNIYISPSTFEYPCELDNLLWKKDKADLDLLEKVKTVKRESRINHDNSEDAVTWNVFRFLEKYDLLPEYLSKLTNDKISDPEMIYWSYSQTQNEQNTWKELQKGREKFETRPRKGSEPDIIIKSDSALFFIEVKMIANNNTNCKSKNPKVQDKYETGGTNWFSEVFKSNFKTVAIVEKKYELLRFWLLGTWMANQLHLDFFLINLVLDKYERNIEKDFKRHIMENNQRKFIRTTWEEIYEYILDNSQQNFDKTNIMKYFENKTIGYNTKGKLQKAFSI